ncbi:MAG: type II toxin-antitoxin system RelE/ParE family toxin [Verrucomicrobia subdivision 3 bacterium]|nr:type II toxin-antitoxin system RelE/ParE family toxin [Limisphaerales bacterium]
MEAQAELQESVEFYGERGGDRLAERFKQHLKAAFKAIQANPERFRRVADRPGVQKFRLKFNP